jgi:hypothetical protein
VAINEWWIDCPEERYCTEIADPENLGADLIAPIFPNDGYLQHL